MVTVSFIVPVYNAEKAIGRCVDSILNQDYQDFEVILVNDGSKDGSAAILDSYAEKDSRVRVVHKENSGVSATRNLAISMAQGKYLRFLDADDWMTPDSTKMMVRAMEEDDCDLVICDFYRVVGENVSRKGSIISADVMTQQEFAENMLESPSDYYYGVLWNKLYRRDIIAEHEIRMDESLSFCEDFIFNLEYYLHCARIRALQIPVYYYVKTEGSLVSQNMSLTKIVQMKTSVFQYYNQFYKNILDEETYAQERLNIARFLVDAASDDLTIPLMPGTKKLGEENVPVFYSAGASGPMTVVYHLKKLYERALNTIAYKYGLGLRDVRVFDCMRSSSPMKGPKEIADYTGLSQVSVYAAIQKLEGKGMIRIDYQTLPLTIDAAKAAQPLIADLDTTAAEISAAALSDFNEEEKEQFRDLFARIDVSLKKALRIEEKAE